MNMWQVIARGASAPAGMPAALGCPFCGAHPPLAIRRGSQFLVGCEDDGCPVQPQVAAASLDSAWALWNRRA